MCEGLTPPKPKNQPLSYRLDGEKGTRETMHYYEINEETARRAKEMNSYFDYVKGSATARYRSMIDEAAEIAEKAKRTVDPMYHDQIEATLDRYARKLAENLNAANAIDMRVPSVMIAGPANFPVRAKEKQNAAREANLREYQEIRHLIDKIRSIGHGGIQSDDPAAIEKLKKAIEVAESGHATMKAINAYYRAHGSLDGCDLLSEKQRLQLSAQMSRDWRTSPVPFESFALTNSSANIRRMRERLASLEKVKSAETKEQEYKGVRVVENAEAMRIQLFFPGKPDEATRTLLKSNGFLWAPSVGAWQRQLTANGKYATKSVLAKLSEQEA